MSENANQQVLVVDDQRSSLESISRALEKKGYATHKAENYLEAQTKFSRYKHPVVVTDLNLPDGTGLDLVSFIKGVHPRSEVIVVTAYGSVETAVEAMKSGAFDYVAKPVNLAELRALVAQAWQKATASRNDNSELESEVSSGENSGRFPLLIGQSKAMLQVFEKLTTVSPTRASVLLLGESGTGKELIAQAIHDASERSHKPYLAINCSAFSEGLLESELFGHEKGSFTGALKQTKGKFELANGGTLFLDEIGEISSAMQVRLLRVLENREIMRVGGADNISIDVRIIAATNKDLDKEVRKGNFREDLYYRLKVVVIEVPPLRERKSDIPLLVSYFVKSFAAENNRIIRGISTETMEILKNIPWKGNVRELRNCIENMVIFSRNDVLTNDDIPSEYREQTYIDTTSIEPEHIDISVGMTMEEIEKEAIVNTLNKVQGNRTQAARMLGIGLRTLQRKIKQFEL
ncbi:sigma-54-dependent transcriptional regulator [Desulfurispira natronophila]|uniref:DNA-binding NtrC family response regulator n=1 Tax=Desulfurispira natronophila TaxID=682562 RepID=A0A7W7Y2B2_9BACT|nr:sigma-54 dependent transcriptional regulator [Desulfurispira natronophila]MBB5020719.1 DNA-binding NtrC family response regulator [Desulfurispira natronophila]